MLLGRMLVVVDAEVASADLLTQTLDCLASQRTFTSVFSVRVLVSYRTSTAVLEYLKSVSSIPNYASLDLRIERAQARGHRKHFRLAAFDGDADYVLFLNQGDRVSADFIELSCLMLDTDLDASWIDPMHYIGRPEPVLRLEQVQSLGAFLMSKKYTSGYVYRSSHVRQLGDVADDALGRNPLFDVVLQVSLLGRGRFPIRTDAISCDCDPHGVPGTTLALKGYVAAIALALRAAGTSSVLAWRGVRAKRRQMGRDTGRRQAPSFGWLTDKAAQAVFRRYGQADRFVGSDIGLLWTLLFSPAQFESRLASVGRSITVAEIRAGFVRSPKEPSPPLAADRLKPDGIMFAHTNWTIGGAERVLQTWMRAAREAMPGRISEVVERESWNMDRSDRDFVLTDAATRRDFAALSDAQYSQEALAISPAKRLALFIELVRRQRPRVLFISGNAFAYAALPTLKRLWPSLVVVDILHNEWNSFFDWFNISSEYRHYIDRRIVISEHWRQVLIAKYQTRHAEIALVSNGVSLETFAPQASRRTACRTRLGFSTSDRVVCFIGRLHFQKNPVVFFKLLDIFRHRPEYRFVVAGDGPERKVLLDKYGDRENLTYLGAIENVAELLDAADLSVFTSEFEGYPIASLEAAAMNVPIIAPDIVGFREQLSLGRFGLSYQPSGDATADADTIAEIITSQWESLSALAVNGRPFVADYHDLREVGQKQITFLQDLLTPAAPAIMARPRKRLYLHIGTPKTGTSSVQWFFDKNRELLHGQGIHYPEQFVLSYAHHPAAHYCLRNRTIMIPRDAFTPYNSPEDWDEAADAFVQEMIASPYDTNFVSSEAFYHADQRRVADLFMNFDTTIVICFRRQDHYLESVYNQNCKIEGLYHNPVRYDRPFAKMDYYKQTERWTRHFGSDNIKIIPFEPKHFPNGLERRFVELIGGEWGPRFRLDIRNSRLNRDCLDFLIHLNSLGVLPRQRYLDAVSMCEQYSSAHPDLPQFRNVFSPAKRREVLEQFAEANALLAARYLPAADQLFDTTIADEDIWQPYPGVSRQMAEDIGDFLAQRGIDRSTLDRVVRGTNH